MSSQLGAAREFKGLQVYFLDTPATLSAALDLLAVSSLLAVDGEGVSLGCAGGKLCILQLCGDIAPTTVSRSTSPRWELRHLTRRAELAA